MRLARVTTLIALFLTTLAAGQGKQAISALHASITVGNHVYHSIPGTTAIIDPSITSAQQLLRHTQSRSLEQSQIRDLGIPGAFLLDISREVLDTELPPLAYTAPVFQGTHDTTFFPAPRILLGFANQPGNARINASLRAHNLTGTLGTTQFKNTGVCTLTLNATNGNQVINLARDLARNPNITFAEPDMIFQGGSGATPNDPFFVGGNLWGIHNTGQFGGTPDIDLNGPEAWDITTGDPSVIVVVIDTGVQLDHPDLVVSLGNDFTSDASNDGSPVNDFDNHGTNVAGCVNATINNSLGGVGIAPTVSLASARTFISTNSSGSWTSFASWTVDTLDWAASIGARVTVNSNFYGFTSSAIETAYTTTRNLNNIIHFAIAGNEADTTGSVYPGSISSVIAIGAIDRTGDIASFSNWGSDVDLFAPGVAIATTDRTGFQGASSSDYATRNGTSFATPYAGGVAALVASRFPELSATDIRGTMFNTTKDLGSPGFDLLFHFGMPDASNALRVPCQITTDLVGDPNTIDGSDLLVLLSVWGPPQSIDADFNDDGIVDGIDLLMLLGEWGTCF